MTHTEAVREVVLAALQEEFGPDNATDYYDDRLRIGVSFVDGTVVDVAVSSMDVVAEKANSE